MGNPFRTIMLLAISILATRNCFAYAQKKISNFKHEEAILKSSAVPPGSWIVITGNSPEKKIAKRVIKSDNYCGLKPGLFVSYDSWSYEKKTAQKAMEQLKSENRPGYLKNVGAWSNIKPCKDSLETRSWRYVWAGGELWGEIGELVTINLKRDKYTYHFDDQKYDALELFEDAHGVILIHLSRYEQNDEEHAYTDNLLIALDSKGKEVFRQRYSVGDDYSSDHCEVWRNDDGELCILRGNPEGSRTALMYDETKSTFIEKFEVIAQ
jgi:hypothetical protein